MCIDKSHIVGINKCLWLRVKIDANKPTKMRSGVIEDVPIRYEKAAFAMYVVCWVTVKRIVRKTKGDTCTRALFITKKKPKEVEAEIKRIENVLEKLQEVSLSILSSGGFRFLAFIKKS